MEALNPHPLGLLNTTVPLEHTGRVHSSSKLGKKAKTNGIYGKKIIMAVKQGGSPDPNANRMLADVIKQAKGNSVPAEVSQLASSNRRRRLSQE